MPDEIRYPACQMIEYRKGEAWREGVGFWDQPAIGDHAQYMDDLSDKGVVILGGPFTDYSGGLAILRGVDPSEAAAIARQDPAVLAGTLSYQVREFAVPIRAADVRLA